jgi:hypothetical protein
MEIPSEIRLYSDLEVTRVDIATEYNKVSKTFPGLKVWDSCTIQHDIADYYRSDFELRYFKDLLNKNC